MYQPRFRKKRNNVPILSRNEIDAIAENYVLDFCPEAIENPQALNIDLFLEKYLGLTLDYQYLSNDVRYLGMTIFNDTSKVIVFLPEQNKAEYIAVTSGTVIIDSSLTEESQLNRYRYTVGHEAGHWVFHKAYYDYDPNQLTIPDMDFPYIQCREFMSDEVTSNTRYWDDNRWMEWQADKFSSCILMPKTAVNKLIRTSGIPIRYEDELVQLTSTIFKVSKKAAKYRLIDLGFIHCNNPNMQLSFI